VSLLSRDPFEQAEEEDSPPLLSEKDLEYGLSSASSGNHLTPEDNGMLDTRRQVVRIPSSTSDLYDASPKNTKPPEYTVEDENRGRAGLLAVHNQQLQINNHQHHQQHHHNHHRPRSRDEKIPINSSGREGEASTSAAESSTRGRMLRDDDEEDQVATVMSATSYPGQEWTPYMDGGGYDDWNE
jgi:hypothetical protein